MVIMKNTKSIFLSMLMLTLCLVNIMAQDKTSGEDKFVLKFKPLMQQCGELKEADDPAIASALTEIAKGDAPAKIRLAEQLGKSCNKKSTPTLIGLLSDEDPMIRIAAIEALAQLGDEAAIDPLIELQNDQDWHVRFVLGPALCAFQKWKASYAALNYIGESTTIELNNENEAKVRCSAMIAVNQLKDVNFSRKALMFMFGILDSQNEAVKKVALQSMYFFKETRNFPFELVGTMKQSRNPSFRAKAAYWIGELKIEKGRDQLKLATIDSDNNLNKVAKEALAKLGKENDGK